MALLQTKAPADKGIFCGPYAVQAPLHLTTNLIIITYKSLELELGPYHVYSRIDIFVMMLRGLMMV